VKESTITGREEQHFMPSKKIIKNWMNVTQFAANKAEVPKA